MIFSKEQITFIKNRVPHIDFSKELSRDDYIEIEDVVGDIYTEEAQSNSQKVSDLAKMCESILDTLE